LTELDQVTFQKTVTVTVQNRRMGLPAIPGLTIAPRPAWMAPMPLNDAADSTIVRQSWKW